MNNSGIEWTDTTWNPVSGCSKVSQGCKNCYAERVFPRVYGSAQVDDRASRDFPEFGEKKGDVIGRRNRRFTDVITHPDRLQAPIHTVKGRRIFVNSMSDLFHEDVPFEFIADVFAVMSITTRHTYQILTKRPQRMRAFFEWLDVDGDWAFPERVDGTKVWPQWTPSSANRGGYDTCGPVWPLENVWLGVSVEDQATADERIPLLLNTPAAVRFVSAEPLLGMVDLTRIEAGSLNVIDAIEGIQYGERVAFNAKINLVIAGYESGPGARPGHPDWAAHLRDQCAGGGTRFFFKQWGEWAPRSALSIDVFNDATTGVYVKLDGTAYNVHDETDRHQFDASDVMMYRVGKKAAGRTLDGREHNDLPGAACTAA